MFLASFMSRVSKIRFPVWSLLIALVLLSACRGARYYTKRAEALREAGLTREAADFYFEALIKNPDYVKARIGIKNTGEKVINAYLEDFFKAYSADKDREAVYAYQKALQFHEKISHFVTLDFPDFRQQDYRKVEARYLTRRYDEAVKRLDKREFEKGRAILDEIIKIKADYRDAASLREFAEVEPVYHSAMEAYRDGNFRRAYQLFRNVQDSAPGYRDTPRYLEKSTEKAALTVAVLPFEGPERHRNVVELMRAQATQAFAQTNDPLLRIIDRENTDELLKEQKLGLSGLVDEGTAASAGQLVGAKAVLTGRLIAYQARNPTPKTSREKGWKAEKIRYKTASGETQTRTKYTKTTYQKVENERSVRMTFQFKLISSETGEILATDLLREQQVDHLEYAEYDGDPKTLYPGFWQSMGMQGERDKVFNSRTQKQSLDQQLNARKKVKSETELRQQLAERISRKTARAVYQYLNE